VKEYGNFTTITWGLSDKEPEDWRVAMVYEHLRRDFRRAQKVHGFPDTAQPQFMPGATLPAYSIKRHDDQPVDYEDPALDPYYSGEGDLPDEYYTVQCGWRRNYGWYYASND
jgi:hypothetical protein